MATITLTIPDNQVSRVLTAFGKQFGQDGQTAATPAQVKAKLMQYVVDVVRSVEHAELVRTQTPTPVDVS